MSASTAYTHKSYWLNTYVGEELVDGRTFDTVKHYAQRWSWTASGAKAAAAANLPGRLVEAFSAGVPLWLATDATYEQGKSGEWIQTSRVSLLQGSSGVAFLLDSARMGGLTLSSALRDGGQLYLTAQERAVYGGGPMLGKAWMPWAPSEDQLLAFDLSSHRLDRRFSFKLGTESGSLVTGVQGHALLSLPGSGLLVLDLSDETRPLGQRKAGFLALKSLHGHTGRFAKPVPYVAELGPRVQFE